MMLLLLCKALGKSDFLEDNESRVVVRFNVGYSLETTFSFSVCPYNKSSEATFPLL